MAQNNNPMEGAGTIVGFAVLAGVGVFFTEFIPIFMRELVEMALSWGVFFLIATLIYKIGVWSWRKLARQAPPEQQAPPVDDAEFTYDASSFEGAGDATNDDENLWAMARDPRTPETERTNAMRLLEKRATQKQITHRR